MTWLPCHYLNIVWCCSSNSIPSFKQNFESTPFTSKFWGILWSGILLCVHYPNFKSDKVGLKKTKSTNHFACRLMKEIDNGFLLHHSISPCHEMNYRPNDVTHLCDVGNDKFLDNIFTFLCCVIIAQHQITQFSMASQCSQNGVLSTDDVMDN